MNRYSKIVEGASVVDIANEEDGFNYYGFIRVNGEWIIMRESTAQTQYRFKLGSSNYSTAWTNRASHTYGLPTIG